MRAPKSRAPWSPGQNLEFRGHWLLISRDTNCDSYRLSLNIDLGGSMGKVGCARGSMFPQMVGRMT